MSHLQPSLQSKKTLTYYCRNYKPLFLFGKIFSHLKFIWILKQPLLFVSFFWSAIISYATLKPELKQFYEVLGN